jgi:glycosyltransferase involved in cell wall biosynthesis
MHVAFAGRLIPPITGSELVMVELFKALSRADPANRYSICLSRGDEAVPEFAFPHGHILWYDRMWRQSLGSILWHQLVLPLLVARHHIDVLFLVQNRVPLLKTCAQVMILHDMAEFRVAHKYDPARDFYRKASLRLAAHRVEHVVTVSESSKRDIIQYLNISPERLSVVGNGVAGDFFAAPAERAALATRYPVDRPYLLYVGALEHPNKNLVRLLEAYAAARANFPVPHRLLLVGPQRWRPEVIFDAIAQLGLGDEVHWLGYVPRADLPALYAAAEAFVFVSLWEGFGLPVLEALAAGTPVIASNTSSLPEVVGEAGLLVDPTSVPAISAALERLTRDADLRARLRLAGPAQARKFSWENGAVRLRQVLVAAVQAHRGQA